MLIFSTIANPIIGRFIYSKMKDTNNLYVIDNGEYDKPTLVMLHGLGGTHQYWNTGLKNIADDYYIIRIDLLGFGDSPQPWQNYTLKKHLTAIERALENYDSFVMVGHSLGAILAYQYAKKHQHKIKSLVLISLPSFKNQPKAYQWMRRTPSGWLMTNMAVAALTCITTRRLAKRILPHFLKEFPPEIISDLVKHNVMSSITTLWNIIYNQSLSNDILSLNPEIPVYCIHAKNDATAPYQSVKALAASFTHWTLTSLEGSDHHPWLWDNEACINIIKRAMNYENTRK